ISQLVREVKRSSSEWIKQRATALSAFYWQDGYGAFSISPSHVRAVKTYIANQEDHHRNVTFQDEFRRLCRKYALEIDERYVWACFGLWTPYGVRGSRPVPATQGGLRDPGLSC